MKDQSILHGPGFRNIPFVDTVFGTQNYCLVRVLPNTYVKFLTTFCKTEHSLRKHHSNPYKIFVLAYNLISILFPKTLQKRKESLLDHQNYNPAFKVEEYSWPSDYIEVSIQFPFKVGACFPTCNA